MGQHSTTNIDDGYLGSGKYIKRAVKKYGKENFTFGILNFCKSKEALNEDEIYWIKYFRDQGRLFLYNIADGGEGVGKEGLRRSLETRKRKFKSGETVIWNKGKKGIYSEEQRKRMSEFAKKQKHSAESKKKRSEKLKGRIVPKEVIDRIVETKRKNPLVWNNEDKERIRRSVVEFNKNNKKVCPHCNKVCTIPDAKKNHFHNCRKNPEFDITKLEVTCPHCGKTGQNPSMKIWHFNRCKLKTNDK